ncbi:hypothetical protein [Nocardioides astragali]|uniref:Uncharacterized protein n=1 Tax=Nocardioides astragali TaxID=1776736 RepID=A0ABW2N755_9ACTN|nr:hypothetical protein [Nocardioides astragali]
MEILLWLAPALVVTVVAMVWVSWVGRDGHGEIDRDVAVERLGKALAKELPAGTRRTTSPARDRSTGIAVRPSHGSASTGDGTRRAS